MGQGRDHLQTVHFERLVKAGEAEVRVDKNGCEKKSVRQKGRKNEEGIVFCRISASLCNLKQAKLVPQSMVCYPTTKEELSYGRRHQK